MVVNCLMCRWDPSVTVFMMKMDLTMIRMPFPFADSRYLGGHGFLGGCNTVGVYNLCTGEKGCPCWCISRWLSGLL